MHGLEVEAHGRRQQAERCDTHGDERFIEQELRLRSFSQRTTKFFWFSVPE